MFTAKVRNLHEIQGKWRTSAFTARSRMMEGSADIKNFIIYNNSWGGTVCSTTMLFYPIATYNYHL